MFKIVGTYKGEKEDLDIAKTKDEAEYLLKNYKMAFGKDWVIEIKEIKDVISNTGTSKKR